MKERRLRNNYDIKNKLINKSLKRMLFASSLIFILCNVGLLPCFIQNGEIMDMEESPDIIEGGQQYVFESSTRGGTEPYIKLNKSANPTEIYLKGSGYNEQTTITLTLTGTGDPQTSPQDVIFIMDKSGSISFGALDNAREAAKNYVDNMSIPDRGAVVYFGTDVVMINSIADFTTFEQLKEDIDSNPETGANSNLGPAMNVANYDFIANGDPWHLRIMIILTDGVVAGDVRGEAQRAAENDIIIFTIGLEDDHMDEELLMEIAEITGGKYYFASNPSVLSHIYEDIQRIVKNTAGYDSDVMDSNPMVRDVLPNYIHYVPGSFSEDPSYVWTDPATGNKILEWNVSHVFIGETWNVSFNVTSNQHGMQQTNVYALSRVNYTHWDGTENTTEENFPECWINVTYGAPLPPVPKTSIIGTDNIQLNWVPRHPDVSYYLIYRAEDSPMNFDFSTPTVNTSTDADPADGTVLGNRLSWNFTNDVSSAQQVYYCIRSVNLLGNKSITSNTVGKWTKNFPGDLGSDPLDYTDVSGTYQVFTGSVTNYINMRNPSDGGLFATFEEGDDSAMIESNVVLNGNFSGNIDHWDETVIENDPNPPGGKCEYDPTDNAPGGSGGSICVKVVTVKNKQNVLWKGWREQDLCFVQLPINKAELSWYWLRDTDSHFMGHTNITIVKPDGTPVEIHTGNGITPYDRDTKSRWEYNIRNVLYVFDQIGIYKLRLCWRLKSHNDVGTWTVGKFDEVTLILNASYTVPKLKINTDTYNIPVRDGRFIEIRARTTGEPFTAQAYNGATWNALGTISLPTWSIYRFNLNSAETSRETLVLRYIDTIIEDFNRDSLYIDYQRVIGFSVDVTTFSVPLEPFETNPASWYIRNMLTTISIKWMDDSGYWVEHNIDMGQGVNDSMIVPGKGYEILVGKGEFTFCGMPGASIRYLEGFGFPSDISSLTATVSNDCVTLNWISVADADYYHVYRSISRDGLNEISPELRYTTIDNTILTWTDTIFDSNECYYLVVPISNILGEGSSSYSIGIWTNNYFLGYDSFSLPLKPSITHSVNWYCNGITDVLGMNYHMHSEQRWFWHKTIMPEGAYDVDVVMAEGYQISTLAKTKYSFVGI